MRDKEIHSTHLTVPAFLETFLFPSCCEDAAKDNWVKNYPIKKALCIVVFMSAIINCAW